MDLQYDEDVSQNPFYCCLRKTHSELFEKATISRWTICVPRVGSLGDLDLTSADFESHILIVYDDHDLSQYKTINNKYVTIKCNNIFTGEGFDIQREIPILFEETFFNQNEESYRVLCINQMLTGSDDIIATSEITSSVSQGAEDFANILWGSAGNPKTRRLLRGLIASFQQDLHALYNPNLKELMTLSCTFFTKAFEVVKKDPNITKKKIKCDNVQFDSIKLAIENHLMFETHKPIFRLLCTCLAAKDAHLNKIIRNLQHVQLQHLDVRVEFCKNVPRARKELSNLILHRTPTAKLACLRRIVSVLTKTDSDNVDYQMALTTDDLLPILVFLILKSQVTNWWAHLEHMTAFRFSRINYDDEYGFYLATLEAALEYISRGLLLDLVPQHCIDTTQVKPNKALENDVTLWHAQDDENVAVDILLQFVRDKNKAAVTEILQKSRSQQQRIDHQGASARMIQSLCHPLCTCQKCKTLIHSDSQKRASNLVTVHSRDSKGQTVLHVAAFYGHAEIVDIVLKQGALVNAVDYLTQTPLHIASRMGHQSVLLLLLHDGAMYNAQDNTGNTALHLATLHGHEDCAKALVFFDQDSGDLDLDAVNDFGDTALHIAAKWGYSNLVNILLDNGASALIKNRRNHDALRYAHNDTIANVINAAIAEQAGPKQLSKLVSPLKKSYSVHEGINAGCRSSLQSPCNTQSQTMSRSQSHTVTKASLPRWHSEIHLSTSSEHSRSNSILGSERSRSNSVFGSKFSSQFSDYTKKINKLLKAVADGDIQMTKFHFGWTCDTDDSDDDDIDLSKRELCHPLCQCKKCLPVQKFTTTLVTRELHVNSSDDQGHTALHTAAFHSHVPLVGLLLRKGANVNVQSLNGTTPLHMACKQTDINVLHVLIQFGADVNAQDKEGNSPLHFCCMMGNESKSRLLLENGADVNHANNRQNSPLHDAVRWNFLHVVRLLLKYGAYTHSRNSDNKFPKHYAQTEEISKVLRLATWVSKPSLSQQTDTSDYVPSSSMCSTSGLDKTVITENPDDTSSIIIQKQSQLPNISDFESTEQESDDLTSHETLIPSTSTDVFNIVVDRMLSDEESLVFGVNNANPVRLNPGKKRADGYFDINLDEVEFDSNMRLIENYYAVKACQRCSHDNTSECDCHSEDSNTESQQDLSDVS